MQKDVRAYGVPRVIAVANPIEEPIALLRQEFSSLEKLNKTTSRMVADQKREIEILTARLVEYQKRYEEAEAKLEKIKGHL